MRYEQYLTLKKHHTRQGENDKARENMLKEDLEELFDIAVKNAVIKIKNKEEIISPDANRCVLM